VLTTAELAAMRDVEESVMSSTAIIRRVTRTPDGVGGYNEAWAAVGTVACDLWAANRAMNENVAGGQIISRGDWYITIPFDSDVKAQDRIHVDGRTFEVVWVPNNQSWSTALRVGANSFNEETRI